MYLNHSTSVNVAVGRVEETNMLIMLYGHIKDRYKERLEPVYKITKMKGISFDKFIKHSINITKEHHEECVNKTPEKERHVIRDEVHLNVEGRHVVIDISLLVTGSVIKWYNRKPRVIDEHYKELVENGDLVLYNNVLAFETMMTTVRFANEKLECFSHQPSIGNYNFPKKIYNISFKDLRTLVEPMLKDLSNDEEGTKISVNVQRFLKLNKR